MCGPEPHKLRSCLDRMTRTSVKSYTPRASPAPATGSFSLPASSPGLSKKEWELLEPAVHGLPVSPAQVPGGWWLSVPVLGIPVAGREPSQLSGASQGDKKRVLQREEGKIRFQDKGSGSGKEIRAPREGLKNPVARITIHTTRNSQRPTGCQTQLLALRIKQRKNKSLRSWG